MPICQSVNSVCSNPAFCVKWQWQDFGYMLAVYVVLLASQYIHAASEHLLIEKCRLVLFVQDVLLHHRFLHSFGSLLLSAVCHLGWNTFLASDRQSLQ